MFISIADSMFIFPICYHPTTIISVDDDVNFLKNLALEVSDRFPIITFSTPEKAIEYAKKTHQYLPFTTRCLIENNDTVKLDFTAIRNEIYNKNRFKEIIVIITDYDMPHISGFELMSSMEFHPEISRYSHILVTGKISSEFKEKLSGFSNQKEYIGKDDPNYIDKLALLIEKRSSAIFQWSSYVPARIISRNKEEESSFLFDGNFADIFNKYIETNNICEFYLYDKQGSYVFLDHQANLSWLIIRNETGIKNSIQRAAKYGAPKSILDRLKGNEILSIYEEDDFKNRPNINWEEYLLPATLFESNNDYSKSFPNSKSFNSTNYYYTFTNKFPEHGIDRAKIVSYDDYLQNS